MQGHLLGAYFYGYTVTQIPGALLGQIFGGKRVLIFAVIGSSLLNLLFPVSIHRGGTGVFIGLRIAQGLCEGLCFPALYAMASLWIPEREKGVLMTLFLSGLIC